MTCEGAISVADRLEDALWDADTAFKRLKPEQGRLARRNARDAMLKALRKARKTLDEEFPLERKPVKRRKRRKHPLDDFAEIRNSDMQRLLLAGIRRTQFKHRSRQSDISFAIRKGRDPKQLDKFYWAPKWIVRALDVNIDIRTIVKAVRSQSARKRIDTLIRLGFRPK